MEATTCRLCGADLADADGPRCPNCGLHRVDEPGPSGYRRLAVGLTGVYVVTALLVLLTRGR